VVGRLPEGFVAGGGVGAGHIDGGGDGAGHAGGEDINDGPNEDHQPGGGGDGADRGHKSDHAQEEFGVARAGRMGGVLRGRAVVAEFSGSNARHGGRSKSADMPIAAGATLA
jgi:hypothetical protein